MRTGISLFFVCLTSLLFAQAQLGPCINTGALPGNGDSIDAYTAYIDTSNTFISGGYQVGETVDDFILFDQNAVPFQLSQLLVSGKPVFILSGSYSCPAYRYTMNQVLPDIIAMYDTNVIFLIVYQMEAHPVGPDYSPFYDTVFTTSQNYQDNILLPQHQIYADRKNRALQAETAFGAICPMLIDGPGNEFWSAYGPSPNNAYLITKDGWVFNKYGWLASSKIQAINDINLLLNTVGIVSPANSGELISPLANPGNSSSCIVSQCTTSIDLVVTDCLGQTVLSGTIAPGETFAVGEGLPAEGIYIITLIADDRSRIITFVKAD